MHFLQCKQFTTTALSCISQPYYTTSSQNVQTPTYQKNQKPLKHPNLEYSIQNPISKQNSIESNPRRPTTTIQPYRTSRDINITYYSTFLPKTHAMWFYWLLFACSLAQESNWPDLSDRADLALRAERDIAMDIPIDQHTPFGISANRLIFDIQGYSTDALGTLRTALNVGIDAVMLDVYWNEYTGRWQLCPAPIPQSATNNRSETVLVSWKGNTYKCQPSFGDLDVYTTLRDYLRLLNTNSQANVVQLVLNLKLILNDTVVVRLNLTNSTSLVTGPAPTSISPGMVVYLPEYMELGNSSLSDPLLSLGSFLFLPTDLDRTSPLNSTVAYDDEYPSQQDFLYSLYKRALVTAVTDEYRNSSNGYNVTVSDAKKIFFYGQNNFTLSHTDEDVLQECFDRRLRPYDPNYYNNRVLETRFRMLIDSNNNRFTPETAHQALQCGYMPVLNASVYPLLNRTNLTGEYTGRVLNNFSPFAYWAWAPYEPDSTYSNVTRLSLDFSEMRPRDDDHDDDDDDYDVGHDDDPDWQQTAMSQVAEKCVVMKRNGWAVENCYNKYRLACKHKNNAFEWTLSHEISLYFSTNQADCPKNYKFGVPHLSTEQLALQNFLNSSSVVYPVWIDLNDITILGCFVDGGPYAQCPYKRAVTTSNLIRLVAPSVVVAVVILILIFFERFFLLTPIHTNRRRHWKRTINQHYKKNDYEGVPS